MAENGTVYARLFDSANQYRGTAQVKVDNIDRVEPEAFSYDIVEITTHSIKIKRKNNRYSKSRS